MKKGISDYAVVYDISCDKERARVDRTLKDFGFRVQKSVFECRICCSLFLCLNHLSIKISVLNGFGDVA